MIEIRPLAASDADAYWHLRLDAVEREPRSFVTTPDEHRATTIADAAAMLSRGDDFFVIGAFIDGALSGMVGFHRERHAKMRHKAHVWGVYVAPHARSQGVARRLMLALIDRARSLDGLEQIQLVATAERTPARLLYESLGFVAFGYERASMKLGNESFDDEHLVLML